MNLWFVISAQVFSFFVGIISYRNGSVSLSGLIALLVISSTFIWLDKISYLLILFYMFASSSILTRFKKSGKKEIEEVGAKSGPRDYVQALSNLGIATLLVLVYYFLPSDMLVAAIVGSVASANADSWASEIGGLSKSPPRLITNFRPIQKGISGGVTLLGMVGGIAGSFFIVVMSVLTFKFVSPFHGNFILLFWSTLIAGVCGFILDSYLGAIFQSLYSKGNKLTENPQGNNQLVKGIRWMNNDMVNFITTGMGAIIAGQLYFLFK